jgi:hypothetical protein
LSSGVIALVLKHNLDRLIANWGFGRDWQIWSYWQQPVVNPLTLPSHDRNFFLTLIVVSIPFVALGIVLTLRRLRDAGWPPYLSLLFFVPFANLLFFLALVVAPSAKAIPAGLPNGWLKRIAPESDRGAAAAGVLAGLLTALGGTLLSAQVFEVYGAGLFIGTPVAMGFVSASLFNVHRPQSLSKTLGVSMASLAIAGALIFALAWEGLICLAMALPIALPLVFIGGIAGYSVMRFRPANIEVIVPLGLLLLPGMMSVTPELSAPPLQVRTQIEIAAPPEVVWRNVVTFSDLPKATEWYFKAGIAYPQRATIRGQGKGALRRCEFSTGAFIEPITAWEAPRRLAFGVTAQPPTMHELSFAKITPPHLGDSYIRSERGEFLLEPLPNGHTRLTGTTWYRLNFMPTEYWRLWSDAIIHRIHSRVLDHIRDLSEAQYRNK